MKKTQRARAAVEDSLPFATDELKEKIAPVRKSAQAMQPDEGKTLLREHVGHVLVTHLGSKAQYEIERVEAKRVTDESTKNMKVVEAGMRDEPEYIRANPETQDDEYKRKALSQWFKSWRPQDLCVGALVFCFCILMLGTAITNLFVTITAVPSPVFMDGGEWKAWLLSLVGGGAALVIKMAPTMLFKRLRDQEMAKRVIVGLTLILVIYFFWLFNLRFDGIGATPNLADLFITESSGAVDHFVFVQILSEILISSVLFLWLDAITAIYSPFKLIPNPDYALTVERYEAAKKHHEQCLARLKAAEETLAAYEAAKAAFISEQIALLEQAVARHNSLYQ